MCMSGADPIQPSDVGIPMSQNPAQTQGPSIGSGVQLGGTASGIPGTAERVAANQAARAARLADSGTAPVSGALGDITQLAQQAQASGAGGAIPIDPVRSLLGGGGDDRRAFREASEAARDASRGMDGGGMDRSGRDRRGDRYGSVPTPPVEGLPPTGGGLPVAPPVDAAPTTPQAPPKAPWEAPPNPFAGMFPPELLFGWGGGSENGDSLRALLGKYVAGVPPVAGGGGGGAGRAPRAPGVPGAPVTDTGESVLDRRAQRDADRAAREAQYALDREARRRGSTTPSVYPGEMPSPMTGAIPTNTTSDRLSDARARSDALRAERRL